jgi:hypothetical protein
MATETTETANRRLTVNHCIVELNEAGLFPERDPTDLEAGANRCAVASWRGAA